MTESEHLPRAPVVEALLDIQVTLPKGVEPDDLAALQQRLGKKYPQKQVRKTWQSELILRPDGVPQTRTSESPSGYLFSSSDGKDVIQARPDGFAFSRLPPYNDWDSFSALAKEGWREYNKLMKPESVNRIALRYINRISLPLPFSDLSEYLLTGPQLAPNLSLNLKSFFFRAVTQDEKAKATAVVTETVEETTTSSLHVPFILDIDVFRVGAFPKEPDKLWPLFSPLRELKNRVFFESITPAAKELFK